MLSIESPTRTSTKPGAFSCLLYKTDWLNLLGIGQADPVKAHLLYNASFFQVG